MRITITALLALAFLLTHAQFKHVTLDKSGNPNEPSIAVHPKTKSIVSASNINNFYVKELGDTEYTKIKSTSPLGVYGDPVLHYSDTCLFFAHLAKTPKKEYGDWFDRIVVQKITDPVNWIEKSYSVGYNANKMQDKPWLCSDNHSARWKGNVYVTWTEFDTYDSDNLLDRSRIRFSKYMASSDTFSAAITLSDTTGDCLDSDNTLEGVTTAVGKKGEIYAVWAGYDAIWLDKSNDGGNTWGKDRRIAKQTGGWDMAMPHIMRANGMPFIACDTVNDVQYVTWADEINGNADVWLIYSKDQGMTWSNRLNLSKDTTRAHQYFPNISINQNTGEVFVAYYDFAGSNEGIFYRVAISKVSLGKDLKVIYVTQNPIPLPGRAIFYGDYLDIDVQDKLIATVYTANDFNNATSIEMGFTVDYTKCIADNVNTTKNDVIAILDEADSLALWVNSSELTLVRYKIKVKSLDKLVCVQKGGGLYRAEDYPKDSHIISIKKPEEDCKVKINVSTRRKFALRKQKYKLTN